MIYICKQQYALYIYIYIYIIHTADYKNVIFPTVQWEVEFNVRSNVYIRLHYRVYIGYTYCMDSNNKHTFRGKARKLNIKAYLKPLFEVPKQKYFCRCLTCLLAACCKSTVT